MSEQSYLELATRLLGVAPESVWDYREGPGGIAFRTPDGYRHCFTFAELEPGVFQAAPEAIVLAGGHAR